MKNIALLFIVFSIFGCIENTSPKTENPESEIASFKPIYFSENSSILEDKWKSRLDSIGHFLEKYRNYPLDVAGSAHPDETEYRSEEIQKKRAMAVNEYLNKNFKIIPIAGYSTEFIGPALGDNNEFIPPPKKEYRRASFTLKKIGK